MGAAGGRALACGEGALEVVLGVGSFARRRVGGDAMRLEASSVRSLREEMREQLAVARRQRDEARSYWEREEVRTHLDFVCSLLDVLGWEDREPERDLEVEEITDVLLRQLPVERELARFHDEVQREQAATTVELMEGLLAVLGVSSA
jgi:hypothetical protein